MIENRASQAVASVSVAVRRAIAHSASVNVSESPVTLLNTFVPACPTSIQSFC